MSDTKRITWIDNVKAFACLLVVTGHLLQSLLKSNIDPIPDITTFINWFIYLFHMPLFMCISGMLYFKNSKITNIKEYKEFEMKKIINLIIPYVTFYIIYFALNILFSKSVNNAKNIEDLLNIVNNPMPPYWFLYALISIFIFIPILDKINRNKNVSITILIIMKIITLFWNSKIYIIKSIMEYGIYFYIGRYITLDKKKAKNNYIYVLVYIILSIVLYQSKDLLNEMLIELIKIAFAISGILLLIKIFKNIKYIYILNIFKEYTFEIYLMHTIFAALIRIVLLKIGIDNYIIHVVMGMTFSIYMPIVVSKISKKIGYTEFFIYPLKTIKKIRTGE